MERERSGKEAGLAEPACCSTLASCLASGEPPSWIALFHSPFLCAPSRHALLSLGRPPSGVPQLPAGEGQRGLQAGAQGCSNFSGCRGWGAALGQLLPCWRRGPLAPPTPSAQLPWQLLSSLQPADPAAQAVTSRPRVGCIRPGVLRPPYPTLAARLAACRSLLASMLHLGQFEFVESWREGPATVVKVLTRPDFGAWVSAHSAS